MGNRVVMAQKKSQPFDKQTAVVMAGKKGQAVGWEVLLAGISDGKTALEYGANRIIFSQGDTANAVFYIRSGWVKLTIVSEKGKEATKALLEAGELFGEKCLADLPFRLATATTMTDCSLLRIEKTAMKRMLHESLRFSELFAEYLLLRNIRYEQDLTNQLFNNSEKRLARTLVVLAHLDKEAKAESAIPRIDQETLAQMVGTTRSRVSHFMHNFRKLGFIEYNNEELRVHSSLLNVA